MPVKHSRGFSMVELMVGVGLAGIVTVLSASTLVSTSNQNLMMARTASADAEQMRLTTLLNSYFGQAIDLHSAGNADLNTYTPTASEHGLIREYDSDTEYGANPRTRTLALFWRDDAHSKTGSTAGLASNLKATAIFFQKPTQTQYGRLFITSSNGAVLQPSLGDQTFVDITRVRISDIDVFQADPANPVTQAPVVAFNLEVYSRHFLGVGEKMPPKTFCPDSVQASGACTNSPHKDFVNSIRITVRNNVLTTSTMGPRGARLFEQIHFFAPNAQGGF